MPQRFIRCHSNAIQKWFADAGLGLWIKDQNKNKSTVHLEMKIVPSFLLLRSSFYIFRMAFFLVPSSHCAILGRFFTHRQVLINRRQMPTSEENRSSFTRVTIAQCELSKTRSEIIADASPSSLFITVCSGRTYRP